MRNLQFVDRSGTVFAELSAQHKKNTECVLDGSTTVQMKFHTDTCAVLEHHLKQLQVWVGEIVRIVKSIPDAADTTSFEGYKTWHTVCLQTHTSKVLTTIPQPPDDTMHQDELGLIVRESKTMFKWEDYLFFDKGDVAYPMAGFDQTVQLCLDIVQFPLDLTADPPATIRPGFRFHVSPHYTNIHTQVLARISASLTTELTSVMSSATPPNAISQDTLRLLEKAHWLMSHHAPYIAVAKVWSSSWSKPVSDIADDIFTRSVPYWEHIENWDSIPLLLADAHDGSWKTSQILVGFRVGYENAQQIVIDNIASLTRIGQEVMVRPTGCWY